MFIEDGDKNSMGGSGQVEVGFEYQIYGGFAAAMHNTEWTQTQGLKQTSAGRFAGGIRRQPACMLFAPRAGLAKNHTTMQAASS